MKSLFWIGLAGLVLGIVTLVVTSPRPERERVHAAGISMGVETRHQEKISPMFRALLVLGGAGMTITGKAGSK